MVKVCLRIEYHKDVLKDTVTKSGTREEFPQIREDILQNVTDRHFVNNGELVDVLQPLGDLIGMGSFFFKCFLTVPIIFRYSLTIEI